MSKIEEILKFNKQFVENKSYEQYITTKYPNKKIAILSCMDTRLTELLPAALNLKNGDVKMVKNAGALISHPFGSVMRSLIVAIYDLGVHEIVVINHYDCGMQSVNPQAMIEKMIERGVSQADLDFINYLGIDFNGWMKGFEDPFISVKETVKIIREHPLIPKDMLVSGFLMDPVTGKLDVVE
ncbi:carbonic anhydrase [Oscillospiraceae bacterium PP1C4]